MESQLLLAAPIQTWPLSTLVTRELLTVAPTQTLPRTMLWTSGLMLTLHRTTSSTKKRRAWEESPRPSRALLQQRSSHLNEGCLRIIRALLAVSSLASEGERGWREIGRQIGIFTVLYQKQKEMFHILFLVLPRTCGLSFQLVYVAAWQRIYVEIKKPCLNPRFAESEAQLLYPGILRE